MGDILGQDVGIKKGITRFLDNRLFDQSMNR